MTMNLWEMTIVTMNTHSPVHTLISVIILRVMFTEIHVLSDPITAVTFVAHCSVLD